MYRPLVSLRRWFPLVVVAFVAGCGSACTMAVDDTGHDERAATGEGATCGAASATPEGWKVRALSTFSIAAPAEGLLESKTTEAMVQFFSPTPGTSLSAFERRDLVSLDEAAGVWKSALGEHCALTLEPTTHLCDPALRLHAACVDHTAEVLVVLRHGATYSASCELRAGATFDCASFLASLRLR